MQSLLFTALACFIGALVLPSSAASQNPDSVRFRIYLTVQDSVTKKKAKASLGFHPLATLGIDTLSGFTDHWYEHDSPSVTEYLSPPVANFFQELRINNVRQTFPEHGLLFGNIHPYPSPSPIDTFAISFSGDQNAVGDSLYLYTHPQILSWPSVLRFYADSIRLKDRRNPAGSLVNVDMTKESTYTYRGQTYHDTISDSYSVEPFNRGFLMIITHPKIPPRPPDTVALVSPPNGSTGRPLNETVQWNAVPGAFFYKVQVDTSRTFANPISTDSIATTSKAINGLRQNTWYYCRVLVGNPFGVSYYRNPADSFKTLTLLPVAPPIISPTPGQTGVSNTPTFSWGAGAGPLTYELQLSTSPAYSPLLQDSTLSSTSVVFPAPLLNCEKYYWRVRGNNAQGIGPFSSASFRVMLATPAVPVIIQYPDNQTGVPLPAKLVWTGRDSCADFYRLQVARDSVFAQLVLNSTVPDTTISLQTLLGLTTYFWRVRAENASFQSVYTPTRRFTTAILPPGGPTLLSPAEGVTIQNLTPLLVWSTPTNNPVTYRLLVSLSNNFTNPLVDDSTLTDTTRSIGPLVGCTRYYWLVRGKNAAGWGFGAAASFSTPLQPPGSPALVIPADGAVNQPTQPLLSWTPSGSCAPSLYIVNLALDTTFNTVVRRDTLAQNSKQVGPLASNTKYFWRVAAVNDSGSGLSAIRSFTTTAVTKPPVPVLIYPPNGLGGLPTTPTLVWDTTARATSWRLQIAYDSTFLVIAFDDSTITSPGKQVGPLLNNTTYYWHVSARNDSGTNGYSPFRRFTTLFPPAAPTLVRPYDASVDVTTTPTFIWSQPSGAVSYQLQVSRDSLFTNFFSNDSGLTGTSWVVGRALAVYTKYFWRVRAKNTAGWGTFSPRASFRTGRVGSANWAIPLAVSETGPARDTVYFGISPQATVGIDPALGEYELPPMANGFFDVRFVDLHAPYLIGEGLRADYLPFSGYTQVDTFKVRFQPGSGTYPIRLSWQPQYIRQICDSLVLTDEFGGIIIRKRMDIDSAVSVANSSISSLLLILHGAFPILDVKPAVRGVPHGYVLSQNYPNPFNPSTRIRFSTERSSHIRITIYDVLGREVALVAGADFFPGIYSVSWSGLSERGEHLPSGIYYARMVAEPAGANQAPSGRFVGTIKMVMLK